MQEPIAMDNERDEILMNLIRLEFQHHRELQDAQRAEDRAEFQKFRAEMLGFQDSTESFQRTTQEFEKNSQEFQKNSQEFQKNSQEFQKNSQEFQKNTQESFDKVISLLNIVYRMQLAISHQVDETQRQLHDHIVNGSHPPK